MPIKAVKPMRIFEIRIEPFNARQSFAEEEERLHYRPLAYHRITPFIVIRNLEREPVYKLIEYENRRN